jgi:putative endonuclease
MTNDLERRVVEHKEGRIPGFTAQYHCNRLVWYERYTSPGSAIAREKQLKGWRRSKKLALIEHENPTWIDLSEPWGRSFLKETAGPSTSASLHEASAQDDIMKFD